MTPQGETYNEGSEVPFPLLPKIKKRTGSTVSLFALDGTVLAEGHPDAEEYSWLMFQGCHWEQFHIRWWYRTLRINGCRRRA